MSREEMNSALNATLFRRFVREASKAHCLSLGDSEKAGLIL